MARFTRPSITSHRRPFAAAAAGALAIAVALSGAVVLSALPTSGVSWAGGSTESATPATVATEFSELLGPDGEARTPGEVAAQADAASDTTPDATPSTDSAAGTGAGAHTDTAFTTDGEVGWFDAASGKAEIMVRFADTGITPAAEGDPVAAAAALQLGATEALAAAEPRLAALEAAGDLEVLNRFWLTAGVLVSATPSSEMLTTLAALPGATSVSPNFDVTPLDDPSSEDAAGSDVPETAPITTLDGQPAADAIVAADTADGSPVTYGLAQINAPEAWSSYGARGQGIRVAVLDTGLDPNHPDLRDRIATDDPHDPLFPGGWIHLDRTGTAQAKRPADPATHGTHVAGTVLGGSASGVSIGVAPDAELMAVNAISDGSSDAKIIKALEWAISPYDAAGNPAGRAADVINMSLGISNSHNETMLDVLHRVKQAGVFPAVAVGNDGDRNPGCVSNPSSSGDAFAVGMTDIDLNIDRRSCGGVTAWPASVVEKFGWSSGELVKPDASAPGVNVYSAVPGGGWGNSSGTSMATPHVAGAVAALRSAQGGLSVDAIAEALESTAWRPDAAGTVDAAADTRYGHGIINLEAAIASVRDEAGVTVTATDAQSDAPLSDVTITYGERGEVWHTDATGAARAYLPAGDYSLTFTKFGYEPATVPVTVSTARFSDLAVSLTPRTTGSASGTVTDASSGAPLAGVEVSLIGSELSAVTAADGSYLIPEVPVGAHRFRATLAGKFTATSEPAEITPSAEHSTVVNFVLAALPRVLVLGDATGRTVDLINTQDAVATGSTTLPADLSALANYDSVIWDNPGTVTAAQLTTAIEVTDRAGTGIVWLDLGASDTSGIAALHTLAESPATRTTEVSNTVLATGYRVWEQPDHPLFAVGNLSTDEIITGSLVLQDTRGTGPNKYIAAFDDLLSPSATVLAQTITREAGSGSEATIVQRGPGIAVDERAGNRHVYLALHGSNADSDARNWSAAGKQLLVNAATWAAASAAQQPTQPEPEVPGPETPRPPVTPTPTPGGTGSPQPPTPTTPTATGDQGTPVVIPPQQQAAAGAGNTSGSLRAPTTQAVPKPEFTPSAPVKDQNLLTARNAGGVTVRIADNIAHLRVPDSAAGDWFFLHVYPTATPVDWIRVNDDGELRVDVSTLQDGAYRFALTDTDRQFVGWTDVQIGTGTRALTVTDTLTDAATVLPTPTVPPGFSLTATEQLMLLGAALLLLTAAGVVLLGLRRSDPTPVGGAAAVAGPGSIAGAA